MKENQPSYQVSGLLNVNKPKGITSHDVVNRIRKLSGQRKVGHAGTLDPMATGVLLICLGQATRLLEYLMVGRKKYRATIRFGITTDTLDAEGEVIGESDPSILTETQLKQILPTFVGEIEQIPPIFSALKKAGQPLYKHARAGQSVEVEPRRIVIDAMTWVAWNPPDLTLDITCSPGAYIRALARDWGEAAGTGAHLSQLTRTASGQWSLSEAVPLDVLEAQSEAGAWKQYLYPPDRAVAHLPRVVLDDETAARVKHGQQAPINDIEITPATEVKPELVRAYTSTGKFLAILTPSQADDKLWQPKKVFQT